MLASNLNLTSIMEANVRVTAFQLDNLEAVFQNDSLEKAIHYFSLLTQLTWYST